MLTIRKYTPNCHRVQIGDVEFFTSYATVVAIRQGHLRYKTDQWHSSTTSKHMTLMGVGNFTNIPKEKFNALVEKMTTIETSIQTELEAIYAQYCD